MSGYVGLLRGVNVGRNKVSMAELADLFVRLGYRDVSTYLQTGNVVFHGDDQPTADLEQALDDALTAALGAEATVLVRTADEIAGIHGGNPYLSAQAVNRTLHVTFLRDAPDEAILRRLTPPDTTDRFTVRGREIYLHCPNGYGRSKLANAYWERALRTPATTRNWNTVTALVDRLAA